MTSNIVLDHPYITIILAAVALNIPFGYIREASLKFSFKWLFWIHASIPFLVYLRFKLMINPWFIPMTIFFAVLGQMIGSRLKKQRMTEEDLEKVEQIPALEMKNLNPSGLDDGEIMVVLLNMGGPKNIGEVRGFLKRIFLDDLIIRFPLSAISQSFFANLIVALRGQEAEKRYQLIGGGSPIFKSTNDQTEALQTELTRRGRNLNVIFSFNYSNPLPEETIAQIKSAKKKYIFPLSLYPHHSRATTGSNLHYLKKAADRLYPELIFLKSRSYYLAESYIKGFVDRISETLKPGESLSDFYLLFSAHGLPVYFLSEGDQYPFEVAQTVALILQQLNRRQLWSISYQSAVGPLIWLKPSTDAMINALAKRGVKKLIVIPISFVTDHIETLCEIDIEYRSQAKKVGIEDFRMSKALESHPGFIKALADCVDSSIPAFQK